MFIHQTVSQQTIIQPCQCSDSSTSSSDGEEKEEEQDEEEEQKKAQNVVITEEVEAPSGYNFYMDMRSPERERDFGWDFFNTFYGVMPEVIFGSGYTTRTSTDDDLTALSEEEGTPAQLEQEGGGARRENEHEGLKTLENSGGDRRPDSGAVQVKNKMGSTIVVTHDSPPPVRKGRELLDALDDIEDHFSSACSSGNHVSRMLEANRIQVATGLEKIKENSTKLIQAITWRRSNIFRSSSGKSLVASSSRNSSSWTEYKNQLFDGYGGMAAGRHSLTLGRLYAWETKLYKEVKAGDNIRKLFQKKCSQLKKKYGGGEKTLSMDKGQAVVKDLYTQILVAIRRAESISENIQKLTAEELQPQIIELLHSLTNTWKAMLECHQTQNLIISQVKTYDCPTYGKFCGHSGRLATCQLKAEIQNWRECFIDYVSAQKSYIKALHGWLSKFIVPEVEFDSSSSRVPFRADGPPLYALFHDWLSHMDNLPDSSVSISMNSFVKDLRALWIQQGQEQEQRRKVNKLARELDKKVLAYQKAECRHRHDINLLEYKSILKAKDRDGTEQHQDDHLMEKRDSLENFQNKLDLEKERHHHCMLETRRTTLNGFCKGFGFIFESLVQFS